MNLLMISLPNPSLERERSGEESEEAVREKRERQEREREGGGGGGGEGMGGIVFTRHAHETREREAIGDCTHCMHNYINAYCTCTYLLAQLMRAYLCT